MFYVAIPSHSVTIKCLPAKYQINLWKNNQTKPKHWNKKSTFFTFCAFQRHIFLDELLLPLHFFLTWLQNTDKRKYILQISCCLHFQFYLLLQLLSYIIFLLLLFSVFSGEVVSLCVCHFTVNLFFFWRGHLYNVNTF